MNARAPGEATDRSNSQWNHTWRGLRHSFSRKVINRLARGVAFNIRGVGTRYLFLHALELGDTFVFEQVRIQFHLAENENSLGVDPTEIWQELITNGRVSVDEETPTSSPIFFYTVTGWMTLDRNFANLRRFTVERAAPQVVA